MKDTDYPLEVVPKTARHSFLSLSWLLLGFTFFTATMFAGGKVGSAFIFEDIIWIMIIGYALLGGYAAVLGYISQKTGLNTVLLARYSFGEYGSRIVDIIIGITQIGWYAWGTATVASLLIKMLDIPSELDVILMVFFGFAFSYTAYNGYKGLSLLSKVSVPLMIIFIAVSIYAALTEDGGWFNVIESIPRSSMPWEEAITVVFGTFVAGATNVTNWTRFADTSKTALKTVFIAFFFGNMLMFFTGVIGAKVYGEPDVVDVLLLQGFATMALLMMLLNIWTTQDNTVYNFAAVGCNFLRSNNRKLMTIIGASIGTLFAIAGFADFLVPYLLLLGIFIPPIGGILFADYVARGGYYRNPNKARNASINFVGIIAYFTSCAIAYYSTFLPPLVAVLTAFAIYLVLYKFFEKFFDRAILSRK